VQESTQSRRPTQASNRNLRSRGLHRIGSGNGLLRGLGSGPRPATRIAKRPTAFASEIQGGFPGRVTPRHPAFDRISCAAELQDLALVAAQWIAAGCTSFLAISSIFGSCTMHPIDDGIDVRALDDLFEIAGRKVSLGAYQLTAVGNHGAHRIRYRGRGRRMHGRSNRFLKRSRAAEGRHQHHRGNHHPARTAQAPLASHRAPPKLAAAQAFQNYCTRRSHR
jgi:hypothetical protein